MTAKMEAEIALQASKDATESSAAKMALSDLEDANDDLTEEHMGETGAGMDYMAAKAAAGKAMRLRQCARYRAAQARKCARPRSGQSR